MSKTCILCHIVFGTKSRKPTLPSLSKPELYSYITGIIKNKGCQLLAIDGMPDHIHLLIDLSPNECLKDVVRSIKQSSSIWIKEHCQKFPLFDGWGKGYYASSVSPKLKESCKDYIKNQQLHHGGEGFERELKYLIEKSGLEWYDNEWE